MNPSGALTLASPADPIPGGAGGQGRRVSFFVPGRPRPQGSKRPIPRPNGGISLVEQSAHIVEWRARVAGFAALAWGTTTATELPVRVTALFVLRRPKSHYSKAKRSAGRLAKHAPAYPIAKCMGDIEKLERAIYDALTGVALIDDGQVVSNHNDKVWGAIDEPEGVHITVEEIVA